MRYFLFAIGMLLYPATSTTAQTRNQLSNDVGDRGVSLGIAMSTCPTLVCIPGYRVARAFRTDDKEFNK